MYSIGGKSFQDIEEARNFYWMVAEEILREAIIRTPKKTGKLINSYEVRRYGTEPNQVYIRNTCDYAVFVHELVFNRHDNGQPKFLEDAGFEVGSKYNVKTYIKLFSVTPDSPSSQTVTCYLDSSSKGYDVEQRRKNAVILFARYYRWRCEIRDKKIAKLSQNLTAGNLVDIYNIKNRDAYESIRFIELIDTFKEWSDSVGGASKISNNKEQFVTPLSKIYTPFPYSDKVVDFGNAFINKEVINLLKEDILLKMISSEISAGNGKIISFVENQLADNKKEITEDDIKNLSENTDTDYFNLDTGRFLNGHMKNTSADRLKILTVKSQNSINTVNGWEDVE